jgi:hypothetical protein
MLRLEAERALPHRLGCPGNFPGCGWGAAPTFLDSPSVGWKLVQSHGGRPAPRKRNLACNIFCILDSCPEE